MLTLQRRIFQSADNYTDMQILGYFNLINCIFKKMGEIFPNESTDVSIPNLNKVLDTYLDKREAEFIKLRHSLDGIEHSYSLKKIASKYNLTHQRVNQTLEETYRKLYVKRYMYSHTFYMDAKNTLSISYLDISNKYHKALSNAGVQNIGDIIFKGRKGLLRETKLSLCAINKIYRDVEIFSKEYNLEYPPYSLEHLDISIRTYNALINFNITSIKELLDMPDIDIKKIPGLGINSYNELLRELNKFCSQNKIVRKNVDLDILNLTQGAYNALVRAGKYSVEDVILMDADEISCLPDIKMRDANIIINRINIYCANMRIPTPIKSIDALNLSTWAYNCLRRNDINTLEEVLNLSINELSKLKGLGDTCVQEIIKKRKRYLELLGK